MPDVPTTSPITATLVIHPTTQAALDAYALTPAHALLVTGAKGTGKGTILRLISSSLLGRDMLSVEVYTAHPYIRIIRSEDGKAISIETIRELQHFLSLKIPGKDVAGTTTRVIVIEDAHLLTAEAQNALLKTLEEPPAGTVLLLTAHSLDSVLPTIQSRVRQLVVQPPSDDQVTAYFQAQGFGAAAIDRALLISGGLPGMTQALLSEDEQHPLYVATTHARGILQSKTYERLLLVDGLAKQKELCTDILYVVGRMARMALTRTADKAGIDRWNRVMRATYDAERQLSKSVQAKLVLTNFMLAL